MKSTVAGNVPVCCIGEWTGSQEAAIKRRNDRLVKAAIDFLDAENADALRMVRMQYLVHGVEAELAEALRAARKAISRQ